MQREFDRPRQTTTTIRLMHEGDVDAIRQVDVAGFGDWWRQLQGGTAELPRRTPTNVLALRAKDPDGCFVAEDEGGVVGLIFSRTWGSVGWFGTFAVQPDYQGRGVGKRLIAASLNYLCRDPNRVIGLETMPEVPYNLGLYLKQGFQARFPTLLLSKTLQNPIEDATDLPRWSRAAAETRTRWLTDLKQTAGEIHPGLDYTKEILSTAQHRFGETLLLIEDGHAVGMSLFWTTNSRQGWGQEMANVQILALHPAYTEAETFRALLDATEAQARAQSKQKLTVPVNARHTWALERLLEWGYCVERAMVRMVLQSTDPGPSTDDLVNLSRWAG